MIQRVTYFCDCNEKKWTGIFIDSKIPRMQCDKCWFDMKTYVEEIPDDKFYLDKLPQRKL